MNEFFISIGVVFGTIISFLGAMCYVFYTRSQVDTKLANIQNEQNNKYNQLSAEVKDLQLNIQKAESVMKEDLYDKLSETKDAMEDAMKQFINTLSEIKQADKEMSVKFVELIHAVKDELRNDYTAKYNLLMESKVNSSDFERLELKFDKFSDTISELKTIVQYQISKDENKK